MERHVLACSCRTAFPAFLNAAITTEPFPVTLCCGGAEAHARASGHEQIGTEPHVLFFFLPENSQTRRIFRSARQDNNRQSSSVIKKKREQDPHSPPRDAVGQREFFCSDAWFPRVCVCHREETPGDACLTRGRHVARVTPKERDREVLGFRFGRNPVIKRGQPPIDISSSA